MAIEAQFTELLGRLRFDDEVLEWVREALHASHADERREHEEAIRRHQAEYKRLDERLHAMYVDKLDGLVDAAFFERMSCTWEDGKVNAAFRQPFDLLAETTVIAARAAAGERAKLAKTEIWLGDLDSNQD